MEKTRFYQCGGCDYYSLRKQNVQKHLQKKNRCCECADVVVDFAFICKACWKKFTFKSGLYKHLKCCSAMTSRIDLLEEEIKRLKEKETERNVINIGAINHNSHNKTVTNVRISPYGSDTPQVSYEQLRHLLGTGARQTLFRLINEQHFNTEKPEAMNFYISNYKDNIGRVFDGEDWGVKNAEILVDEVFERYRGLVDDMLDDLMTDSEEADSLDARKSKILEKFGSLIDKWQKRTGRNGFEDGIKEELKDLIYGKKGLVKRTHGLK